MNLISSFEEYGDVKNRAIQTAPSGSDILIGYRTEIWVHDGQVDTTDEIRIFNSAGNRVAINQDQDAQLTEGNGPQLWEGAMTFTADWEPGEYSAEVIIRDNISGKVSQPETSSFEITRPEPKLEVIRAERYSDTYDSGVRGTAKNVSDQELSYAEVTVIFLDGSGRQLDSSFDNTSDLAPGREWQFDVMYWGNEDFADFEIKTD